MASTGKERVVICIGDIHGYISRLQKLWANLQNQIDKSSFQTALVIFLGDYCDRGPDTKSVIDFLVSLSSLYPDQTHVFLAGNHEFSFAAFIGALPPTPDGSPFSDTWKAYEGYEEREGWFKGLGYEDMHVQGRRWGGVSKDKYDSHGCELFGSVYDAMPTFESYGVPHGSQDLVEAVPEEHKKFLRDLVWVHEEENIWIETSGGRNCCKLIAVHAGFEKSKGVEEQLKLLKARDTSLPKVEALSGRGNAWEIPEELSEKQTIVVSGHHGKLHIQGMRLIIDESGGQEQRSLAAVVLPSVKIVRDTDVDAIKARN